MGRLAAAGSYAVVIRRLGSLHSRQYKRVGSQMAPELGTMRLNPSPQCQVRFHYPWLRTSDKLFQRRHPAWRRIRQLEKMSAIYLRPLPDPEIGLRDARDFILGSPLSRRALGCSQPFLFLFLHDLLEVVYRLVQSCHLPEFTDHGLPHLCSLVDRVSR